MKHGGTYWSRCYNVSFWIQLSKVKTQVHQYVVSLSKKLNPQCFSQISCKISTRWKHTREQCLFSAMNRTEKISLENRRFLCALNAQKKRQAIKDSGEISG